MIRTFSFAVIISVFLLSSASAGDSNKTKQQYLRELDSLLEKKVPNGIEIVFQSRPSMRTKGMTHWRTHTLKAKKLFTEADIKEVAPEKDSWFGVVDILLTFKPESSERFWTVTKEHTREKLAIVFDGKVISAPIIQAEISDGKAVITQSIFEKDEALRAAVEFSLRLKGALKAKAGSNPDNCRICFQLVDIDTDVLRTRYENLLYVPKDVHLDRYAFLGRDGEAAYEYYLWSESEGNEGRCAILDFINYVRELESFLDEIKLPKKQKGLILKLAKCGISDVERKRIRDIVTKELSSK